MTTTALMKHVPKDPVQNMHWRGVVRRQAAKDVGLRRALWQACAEDVLFFFNAFLYCHEPRALVKVRPFCTWPHQDPALVAMDEAISESEQQMRPIDLVVDKSRGQGATFGYCGIIVRRWLRDPMFSAGLVTRNESLVDSRTDSDTLMWKICWLVSMLPDWMLPKGFSWKEHRSLAAHTLFNPEKYGAISGYASTKDVGRGGRKTLFGVDEFGSFKSPDDYLVLDAVRHNSYCNFLVSTYERDSGAYYEAASLKSSARKVVLDWKDNPTENRWLYVVKDGRPKSLRGLPDDYHEVTKDRWDRLLMKGFIQEGQTRSPWYDAHCDRPATTPRGIARQLDRNPRGAAYKLYPDVLVDKVRGKCQRPWHRGRLSFTTPDAQPVRFHEHPEGPLKLWCDIVQGKPNVRRAVIGGDPSLGSGSDETNNSGLFGIDLETGRQFLEFCSHRVGGRKLARYAVALCRWCNGALLNWETNGPGGLFSSETVEVLEYPYIYYRETEVHGDRKATNQPGWYNSGDNGTGAELHDKLIDAMESEKLIPLSEAFVGELGQFDIRNGKIVHTGAARSTDQTNKGTSHADLVIAGGAAYWAAEWLLAGQQTPKQQKESEDQPRMGAIYPYGSPGWRWQEAQARENELDTDTVFG